MRLYERLADEVAALIRDGTLRSGARAPSVRQLGRDRGASPATVTRAYELLQARGYLEARPRSGFFVCVTHRPGPSRSSSLARAPTARPRPEHIDVSELVFRVLEATRRRDIVPLGSAFPSPLLYPLQQLAGHLAVSARRLDPWTTVEHLPPGNIELRRQIAQRYRLTGADVSADEIVITAGGLEALNLALLAVTAPNDIVAIEAPAFYGCLQAIESAGRRAIEVRTDVQHGVDVDDLERILERTPVRACWFMTTFHNPLGTSMPEAAKRRLVRLLVARNIPLIDDNVYAELYFGAERPKSAKVFDNAGLVLDCGSFAKSLAPGYRVGWVAAGRFATQIWQRKVVSSVATNIPAQAALARYLQAGTYDRHLRRLRRRLEAQQRSLTAALSRYFPKSARWIAPQGGYQLWAELPDGVDAIELHRSAIARGISIAPGPIFSARREFKHAIRLNFGHPWTPPLDKAIQTIGKLISP